MIDYLEEHLSSAEVILKRIRQLEQGASGLSGETVLKENTNKSNGFVEKMQDTRWKSDIATKIGVEVYNADAEVNQTRETVNDMDIDLKVWEKKQNIVVNRKTRVDNNCKELGQIETVSAVEETGARTNTERADSRLPLSAQLEELDRTVSALTTLAPEGRGSAQRGWSASRGTGGYPVSLSGLQAPAVDPNITGVPGEGRSAMGTQADADFACGGTQSWAEQADRIFRRDSRRYDGGFYLY